MTQDVSWPKASEGGKAVGKKRSAPIGLDNGVSSIPCRTARNDRGRRRQDPRQGAPTRQKPSRDLLSDSEVLHVFTVNSGLIAAMDLGDEADPTAGPSAAFAHRS